MISDPSQPRGSTKTLTPADRFFSSAVPRMLRFLLILGAAFTLFTAWHFGLIVGLGFEAGSLIAYWSFRSLHKAVQSLASPIVDANQPERGYSLVRRFCLRYLFAGGPAPCLVTYFF